MFDQLLLKFGLDYSGVKLGLNKMKGEVGAFRNELSGSITGALSGAALATGLTTGFASIIQDAGRIADLSSQFGTTAESLQRIGNTASLAGVEMESVASSLNKTALAQIAAADGEEKITKALADLNISVADFINADVEGAFYLVADATHKAEDRGIAYAAVVDIMGKSSGSLFTTLEQGSATIRETGEAMGVMSDITVAQLDEAGDRWQSFFNQIKVGGANVIGYFTDFGKSLGVGIYNAGQRVGAELGLIDRAESARNIEAANQSLADDLLATEAGKPKRTPFDPDADDRAKAESKAASTAKSAAEKLAATQQRIAEAERANTLAQLDDGAKLNALLIERADLLAQIEATTDPQARADLQLKATQLQGDITQQRQRVDANAQRGFAELAKLEKERAAALEKAAKDAEAEKPKLPPALPPRLYADGLTAFGAGHAAALGKPSDPAERTARAAEKLTEEIKAGNKLLERIEAKTGKGGWQ